MNEAIGGVGIEEGARRMGRRPRRRKRIRRIKKYINVEG